MRTTAQAVSARRQALNTAIARLPAREIRGVAIMQPYANLSGDSGVKAFAIRADALIVQFVGGEVYRYTRRSAGSRHLAAMKQLALAGQGLASYISRHREIDYER